MNKELYDSIGFPENLIKIDDFKVVKKTDLPLELNFYDFSFINNEERVIYATEIVFRGFEVVVAVATCPDQFNVFNKKTKKREVYSYYLKDYFARALDNITIGNI